MNSILYAASIGTFATWLGVSGASSVGMLVPGKPQILPELKMMEGPDFTPTPGEFMEVDTFAGGSANSSEVAEENNAEEVFQQEAETMEIPQPEIPEVQDIAETQPLPEVPELPEQPQPKPSQDTFAVAKKAPTAPKAAVKRTETARSGSNRPVAKRTESGTGTGKGNVGTSGSGAGMQGLGKISGGRRPEPPYPPAARKAGVEGVVRVSMTFGENGEVINCDIISAAHPLLNNPSIIIPAMRRWKVPGARGTYSLPIRFSLK